MPPLLAALTSLTGNLRGVAPAGMRRVGILPGAPGCPWGDGLSLGLVILGVLTERALQLTQQPADFVMSVLPEQIMAAPGVKVVGEIPASLGLKIDFGGGVLTKATNPELARQFLDYLSTPEAQAIWKSGGVAVPIPAN